MLALSLMWILALAPRVTPSAAPPPGAIARCALPAIGSSASTLSLDLNIPAYRLDVHAGDQRIHSYTVAVGMPKYRTPTGSFSITEVTWNPWWFPPPSDWARDERPAPPGPDNPMGRVKLRFGPLVFLHGTPKEESLGSAASHACVRMANRDAIELATLVHQFASPDLSAATVDSLAREGQTTREVTLRLPVPLTIRYEVAEVRDDSLSIHPDVYERVRSVNDEVLGVLARHGYPADSLDLSALGDLIRRSRAVTVSVALDALAYGRPYD
jgi:murein L,D-transpeptidase YcbB/YkuD